MIQCGGVSFFKALIMKIGDFEIDLPDPPLQDPHCIAILKPWINVGNVGKIVLGRLRKIYSAESIGQLSRPSKFYDFTRYRPEIKLVDDRRLVRVPNTRVTYSRRPGENDFVFIELLEPHSWAEDFNDSVIDLIKNLGVVRYVQIGAMYDSVPHSRELSVTGSARGWHPPQGFGNVRLGTSRYQGPTSMASQISERIHSELNIETLSLMVHLPLYLKLDDDFAGGARILKLLSELYGFSAVLPEVEMGEKQYDQVGPAMTDNPALQEMVERFERESDIAAESIGDDDQLDSGSDGILLSPEIEQFLSQVAENEDHLNSDEDEIGLV